MKGYKLNDDMDYVKGIMEGIHKKGGHCPCRVNVDETTLCPCDEFMDEGKCMCRLFVKEDQPK